MTVSAAALSYASPTVPMDATKPSSATVSVNLMDVYCDPASLLSRIRLNSDYAEDDVKPRNRSDARSLLGMAAVFSV